MFPKTGDHHSAGGEIDNHINCRSAFGNLSDGQVGTKTNLIR